MFTVEGKKRFVNSSLTTWTPTVCQALGIQCNNNDNVAPFELTF